MNAELAPLQTDGIPGEVTTTGLQLDRGLSFHEWEAVGRKLGNVGRAVMWWIGDWINYGEDVYGEKYSQALEVTGYDYETLRAAGWVAGKVETVRRRTVLSWSHHKEVAALPPAEQDAWLDKAGPKKDGEPPALSVHDLRQAIKREKAAERIKQANPQLSTDADKYSIIYADPPWRYEFVEADNRAIENQYPTMSLDEICDLPVADVAAEGAMLFMWATSPKLAEAMRVLEAWGFEYRTCMVWVKDKIGMGYYARQRHELLLIARRGEFPVPLPENRPDSVVTAPRTKHSAKPPEFYDLLERMYPDFPKIELFCRQPREGWAVWGNEIAA